MLMRKEKLVTKAKNTDGRLAHALRFDWLGQMMASILWVLSVFSYGITSTGDVLQLCAALAWALANLDALMRASDRE